MYFGLICDDGHEARTAGYTRLYAGHVTFKMSPGEKENEVIFVNMDPMTWAAARGRVVEIGIYRDADSPEPFYSAPLDHPANARGDTVVVARGRLQIIQVFKRRKVKTRDLSA